MKKTRLCQECALRENGESDRFKIVDKLRLNRVRVVFGFFAVIAIGLITFDIVRSANESAAISIEASPPAIIYFDGQQVGKTPLEIESKKREITLKLVPESFDHPYSAYETKVNLNPGVKTIVRRVFGITNEKAETQVISFERTGARTASAAVVSIPDGARISIDGEPKGVTPIRVDDVSEGTHSVTVDSFGYKQMNFEITPIRGYLLTALVDLSTDEVEVEIKQEKIEEEAPPPPHQEVVILNTPTGFLRVRDVPSIGGQEVARVEPGEKFKALSLNAENGWYEIEIDATRSGWVSVRYASDSSIENEDNQQDPNDN